MSTSEDVASRVRQRDQNDLFKMESGSGSTARRDSRACEGAFEEGGRREPTENYAAGEGSDKCEAEVGEKGEVS